MSNTVLRPGRQQPATSAGRGVGKSDSLDEEPDARPRATRAKWQKRLLQRGLLKVWIGCSVLWIGCILAILGQCVYGPWIGWQQPQCDGPSANSVVTYLADIVLALGPPAAVLVLYRVVMWWSRRVRRSR
jgi:hypothetical protein